MPDFRRPFIERLTELADDRTVFIVADVGFSHVEKLQNKLGGRFLNLGITEASAVCTAAGLAKEGYRVFIYSMTNFVLFRTYEQVRNMVAAPELNVKLLGVEGSPAFSFLGLSHNKLHEKEDINLCHNIGLDWDVILDEGHAKIMAEHCFTNNEPMYFRL